MNVVENYGVISGFLANSSIISQCDECSCVDHCDCPCSDDDN